MNPAPFSRRSFFTASGLAAMAAALPDGLLSAQDAPSAKRPRIKIGQIGTGNQHASKIGTLRRLTDLFEVVGVAEDDPAQRAKALKSAVYKGLTWMTSDELLAVPGLQAVAVETEEHAPIPTALRCIRAGKHIHLDKPCGESLPVKRPCSRGILKRWLRCKLTQASPFDCLCLRRWFDANTFDTSCVAPPLS